ncbi:MAG: NUDIX hydrolase [Bacteroidetes bacterium]|nr:NUDIX hydrolase [Bacteroidota bacterium]
MHRKSLLGLLDKYKLNTPDESDIANKFVRFISDYQDCFERSQIYGHITGSAWLLNKAKSHALLTHHKKLDKWLQLGGHSDGDPNTLNVAIREVEEESGLSDSHPYSKEIFDIDVHPIPARGTEPEHFHFDIRFLMICNGSEEYLVSDESHDLKWIELSKINEYTQDESVLRLVRKSHKIFGE